MKIIWGIAIFLLVYGGAYYSVLLKFPQFQLKKIVKSLKTKTTAGISIFGSLSMSLSARIGVGSLAGMALAIYYGGAGSIFWIWLVGIINSVNTFVECYLGLKYQKIGESTTEGGPAFYILKGLKNKVLSKTYAIVVILAYIVGFISIQANTISVSIYNYFGVPQKLVGLFLAILVGFSIAKGIIQITKIAEKLVKWIAIMYIFVTIFVIFKNFHLLPGIIRLIIGSAFNLRSFGGGVLSTALIGIQRGVFSTESGLGTSSIASSCSYSKDKLSICFSQIFGIFFTIFVICTPVSIMILTSDYTNQVFKNINGIELTQYAFSYHMGPVGIIILIISVIVFAYSTIIAGYYYGESNIKFLFKNKDLSILLKSFTLSVVFFGSVLGPKILWNMVDFLISILAIINMYSILRLNKEVKEDYQNLINLV